MLKVEMDEDSGYNIPLVERLQLWDEAIAKPCWNLLEKIILVGPRDEHLKKMLRRCSPQVLNAKGILFIRET